MTPNISLHLAFIKQGKPNYMQCPATYLHVSICCDVVVYPIGERKKI